MGQANAAVQEQMQKNHTQALTNLATATAADRQVVTTLTATNAQLTAELAIATATIATLQKKVATLSANRSNRRPKGGGVEIKNQNFVHQLTQMDIAGHMDIVSVPHTTGTHATTALLATSRRQHAQTPWGEVL